MTLPGVPNRYNGIVVVNVPPHATENDSPSTVNWERVYYARRSRLKRS